MILNKFKGLYTKENIANAVDKKFPYRTEDNKPSYHHGQRECIIDAVDALMNKDFKHVIIDAPTGVGKSIIARMIHTVISYMIKERFRTTISCPTKGLQEQYVMEDPDMANLKGKKNYTCVCGDLRDGWYYNSVKCKMALRDQECSNGYCPYVQARSRWCYTANLRVTNTAMALEMCPTICMKDENRADMHIMDECHKLPNALLDHTIMEFDLPRVEQLKKQGIPHGKEILDDIEQIMIQCTTFNFQQGNLTEIPSRMKSTIGNLHINVERSLKSLEDLLENDQLTDKQVQALSNIIDTLHNLSDYCEIIVETDAEMFIVHEMENNDKTRNLQKVRFKPVLPRDVVEYGLYRKNDYFVHMSATICGIPKYAETMGIKEGEYFAIEVEHPIPRESRVITYLPVGKMSGKFLDATKPKMLDAIDELIDMHINENGLVHTASYALAEYFKTWSKHSDRIIIGRDRKQTLEWLKHGAQEGNKPVVVFSPSMIEGYDLKGDLCRFMICAKVPFPYLGDPLIKYQADKDFGSYGRDTILAVVQGAGRGVRGVGDWSAYYMLDASFDTLMNGNNIKYMPKWFVDAIDAEGE